MILFLSYLTPMAAYQFLVFSLSGYSFCSNWLCHPLSASAPVPAKPGVRYSYLISTHSYDCRSVIINTACVIIWLLWIIQNLVWDLYIPDILKIVPLSERPSWNATVLGSGLQLVISVSFPSFVSCFHSMCLWNYNFKSHFSLISKTLMVIYFLVLTSSSSLKTPFLLPNTKFL